ncbi:MAG: ferrochelatase, partial [Gammaproteobacteria bacterium]
MSRIHGRKDFEHGRPERTGILLSNLGTPDAPTPAAVRRFLAEFLRDPRVVELPRLLWLPLLHGIILNTRPRRVAHAYATIWTAAGSPLLTLSAALAAKLERRFHATGAEHVSVALGMRYGQPDLSSAIEQLIAAEARRIVVLPLYPQYASATTASVYDAVYDDMRSRRWVPELRFVADYYDHPAYIAALADSVRAHWAEHGRGERLLMSFHGIPRDTFLDGDPYHCQCQATGRALAAALELSEDAWQLCFQSRVGPKEWLEPYTDRTLEAWGRDGVGDIDVICPGFAVDCLETLEEIALQNAAAFREAG